MKNYGIVYGTTEPQPIEITSTSVFTASNVEPYTQEIEGKIISAASIASLQEELAAAKVLLGVE